MANTRGFAGPALWLTVIGFTVVTGCSDPVAIDDASKADPLGPAASFCGDQDGIYVAESNECRLSNGSVVDAWTYYRNGGQAMRAFEGPNPAIEFCEAQGGEYLASAGRCRLANGISIEAWHHLRQSVTEDPSLANPAAEFCQQQGGEFAAETGLCVLPSGSVSDAWENLRMAAQPGGPAP